MTIHETRSVATCGELTPTLMGDPFSRGKHPIFRLAIYGTAVKAQLSPIHERDFGLPPPVTSVSNLATHTRDMAFDYLKATVIPMVVAITVALPTRLSRILTPQIISNQPHRGRCGPLGVLRLRRKFNDACFMSLMFFISGLFVWRSLRRSGVLRLWEVGSFGWAFLLVGVLLFVPLAATLPGSLRGMVSDTLPPRIRTSSMELFPGPFWFIWLLLFFDSLAALLFAWPRRLGTVPRIWTKRKPLAAAAGVWRLCGGLPAGARGLWLGWGAFFITAILFPV